MSDTHCPCGQRLPLHVAEFLTEHVCSCERRFLVNDSKFTESGRAVNPFARHDAVRRRKPARRGGAK